MAFVYDKAKVLFRNIAGEIVLPNKLLIDGEQFARTPFMVKFQSGWCKFALNTVHLYYGEDTGEKLERRIKEIGGIAKFLAARAEKDEENYILLGDMNIVSPTDPTMKALRDEKFVLPVELAKENIPSNMNRDKFYDQIAFYSKKNELELGKSAKKAGVFTLYESVFREADWKAYFDGSTSPEKWGATDEKRQSYFTKKWRTWQMSDHLPLWTELNIDFTDKYLKKISVDT